MKTWEDESDERTSKCVKAVTVSIDGGRADRTNTLFCCLEAEARLFVYAVIDINSSQSGMTLRAVAINLGALHSYSSDLWFS